MRVLRAAGPGFRLAAKQATAAVLERTPIRAGLVRMRRRSARGRARVLVVAYHHVVPDFERTSRHVIPALVTSTSTFERQLTTLARSYRFASLSEALDVLGGRSASDRDLCVITFDDGYRTFLQHALRVLGRMGVPATLYVPSGFVGGSEPLLHDRLYSVLRGARAAGLARSEVDVSGAARGALEHSLRQDPVAAVEDLLERWSRRVCLSLAQAIERTLGEDPAAALRHSPPLAWDELHAVRDAGVEIGSHTVDHACVSVESSTEVVRQLRNSKSKLESELGTAVVDFSYPNGWYTQRAVRELEAAGYRSAMTTEGRVNQPGANLFALSRKVVWEFTSRGVRGFSPAVAACNFDDVFTTLGLGGRVVGEKPDPPALH